MRRLHSLSGIVPIGGYLAFHLYENYTATRGGEAYNRMVRNLQETPFAIFLEIGIIIVPLLFHGVYGLFVTGTARPNVTSNRYVRNWMYFLQRATGVILFAFVIFHLWTTRLVNIRDHESVDLFRLMQESLQSRWIYAFYIVGILSATFHLANGIWSFSIVWGLTVGPRAQRRMIWVSAAVFLILSFIGIRSIQAFRA
ncbi:MAG: succinate dehydrogenase [Acidobacteria bacterium]|nr:MAG: succinate dehydrogenase [Acidobacteriota bacterium]